MSEASDDNIIARCPECKRITFIAANIPVVMDKDMFKEVGELIKAGCSIEHITTEDFRKQAFRHSKGCSVRLENKRGRHG